MPTFITLVNFTEQGARNVKESPDRFEAYKQLAEASGITVKSAYWTQGAFDMVLITDGPEDASVTTALKVASLGNVRTQTLRGYSSKEMRQHLSKLGS